MSGRLVWRQNWDLGIGPLDADHREMVRLLNRLIDGQAMHERHPQPDSQADCLLRLAALMAELRRHFAREERFLAAIGFPGLHDHQREHQVQMAEFVAMHRALEARTTNGLDRDTVQGIKNWFFDHVIAEDRQYAAFYFGKYGNPPPPGAPRP